MSGGDDAERDKIEKARVEFADSMICRFATDLNIAYCAGYNVSV